MKLIYKVQKFGQLLMHNHVEYLINKAQNEQSSFIDLGNCGLVALPDSLVNLKDHIEAINLGENYSLNGSRNLSSNNRQPNAFGKESNFKLLSHFKKLKRVSVRYCLSQNDGLNDLQSIDELHYLDVSKNSCIDSAALSVISRFHTLEYLDLSHNRLTGTALSSLKHQQKLAGIRLVDMGFLDDSQMDQIIRTIVQLPLVRYLDISRNKVGSHGLEILCENDHLTRLNIADNDIDDNIDVLKNLSSLEYLDMSNNLIGSSGGKIISFLTKLKELNISNNALGDIDLESFASVKTIIKIEARNNGLKTKFFRGISKLVSLKSLDVGKNKLTKSNIEAIYNCSNLTQLKISNCEVRKIERHLVSKLSRLQELDISSNRLEVSDLESISTLLNLEIINLSNTGLTDAGVEPLQKLNKLISLDVSRNSINDNGTEYLKNIYSLEQLYIQQNHITEKGFRNLGVLAKIKTLNLSNNEISKIPKSWVSNHDFNSIFFEQIGNPKNTTYLFGNPFPKIPKEVESRGKKSVIEYLSEDLLPLNECKLIFLGEGSVGKTSLMKALVTGEFDPSIKLTHGINKIAWKGITNAHGEAIRVNLWDFGGQHIQHSLHQFFLTERVIYVLVLNPRNDDNAHFWLEQIEKLGPNSKILVVYNWKDSKDKEAKYLENFYELRKKYSSLDNPILLSCSTGEGMEIFREAVIQAVLSHEGLQTQYPTKWFKIKTKLESEISVEENYIEYSVYEKWCDQEQYFDQSSRKNLLKILDSIGSIVFFDKPILNQLQVLNPEWITTGAYSILTSEITKIKHGSLDWADIVEIFSDEKEVFSNREIKIKYSEMQFHFIIQLMLEYHLCQKNPFKSHNYLIPAAFGEKPQNDYEKLVHTGRQYRLKFESPFEMLIIHRFIAKNILNVVGDDYWHSGIFFKHQSSESFALVTTNLYSQQIECKISGENIRGLWEVIREDFRSILRIYYNFNVNEEVLYNSIDGRQVFLPYQEMLDALKSGVETIEYHPTYRLRNIKVLEVLDLFEAEIESRKQIDSIDDIKQSTEEIDKALMVRQRQKDERDIENKHVIKWKRKAIYVFFSSLIASSLIYLTYLNHWIFSNQLWTQIEATDTIKIGGIIITIIWNTFVCKILYDRYFDPTKEKGFREELRQRSQPIIP